MKRAAVIVILILAASGGSAFLLALQARPDDSPEYFFTRLAYTENGDRGYGRRVSSDFVCPEFGGGNFFPLQSSGWGMDYPGADCKFLGGIHRLTNLRVTANPNVIGIMDPSLFRFPYAYMVEPGGLDLTEPEVKTLREYLMRGGFLHADDFWGGDELSNFAEQMQKVLPEYRLEVLPLNHPVFHTFFEIGEVMQIPGQRAGCNGGPTYERNDDREPRILGISDDKGKLMVVVTYNSDLGDAWEYEDLACYPEKYSGQSYRLGLNFIIYAMTH
jgi:Domain of unknown function (DUF4159)